MLILAPLLDDGVDQVICELAAIYYALVAKTMVTSNRYGVVFHYCGVRNHLFHCIGDCTLIVLGVFSNLLVLIILKKDYCVILQGRGSYIDQDVVIIHD